MKSPNTPNSPNPEFQNYYFEEDTISFSDIMLTLARQIKVILITPTIFCTYTIINVLFYTQPIYRSTAKIISSGADGGSQAAGLAAQLGFNLHTGQSEQNWVYPEIIKSRTLAKTMLKRKFNTEKYGLQKSLLQILTYGNQEPTVGLDTLIKAGVDGAIGMIDIEQNGSFYDLTISAPEPIFARDFGIALIEELDAHQRKYNKAKTSKTKQFIEERVVDIEKELNTAEEALRDFTTHNRRIDNSALLLLERQKLAREVTVLIGVFTTLKQQLETTKIEEVKESDYVVVLDPPEAPLQRSNPSKRLMVILSGIIGIGLGIVLAFIREFVANSDKEKDKMSEAKSLVLKNILDLIPLNHIK